MELVEIRLAFAPRLCNNSHTETKQVRKGTTDMTEIFEAQGNTEETLRVAEEVEERLPHVADALRELVANGTTTIHPDGSVTTSN